jgi:hypothetical protein
MIGGMTSLQYHPSLSEKNDHFCIQEAGAIYHSHKQQAALGPLKQSTPNTSTLSLLSSSIIAELETWC